MAWGRRTDGPRHLSVCLGPSQNERNAISRKRTSLSSELKYHFCIIPQFLMTSLINLFKSTHFFPILHIFSWLYKDHVQNTTVLRRGTFDKSLHEYYTKLSDFHAQFRMVGNNYNQTLKELKGHSSERRAMALVCKLEKNMMQLVQIMTKVTELTW